MPSPSAFVDTVSSDAFSANSLAAKLNFPDTDTFTAFPPSDWASAVSAGIRAALGGMLNPGRVGNLPCSSS